MSGCRYGGRAVYVTAPGIADDGLIASLLVVMTEFLAEPETWPVFHAYLCEHDGVSKGHLGSHMQEFSRVMMEQLGEFIARGAVEKLAEQAGQTMDEYVEATKKKFGL